MLKVLFAAAVVAVFAADCGGGSRPNPKLPDQPDPKPQPTEFIRAPWAQLCINRASRVRQPDADCDKGTPGFIVVYVSAAGNGPATLPAEGRELERGRGVTDKPANVLIVHVPPQGAAFIK